MIDYNLSFSNQGKQISVFHLQPTNGSCCFPLVPFSGCIYCIYSETAAYIYVDIYLDIYMLFLLFQTENGKRKPRQLSLIHLPGAHRAKGSLLFVSL
jgi:hypothetical protein